MEKKNLPVHEQITSHSASSPRAARHDMSFELLTRHFSSQVGHMQNELTSPKIKAKREAAMRDAQENYEIMMEFQRELREEFSKFISAADSSSLSEQG